MLKLRLFLIFFLFFLNFINLNSLNILFISQNYKNESDFIDDSKRFIEEIINFNPVCQYLEHINFYYIFESKILSKDKDFDNFEISNEKFFGLINRIEIKIDLAILIINSKKTDSKGGTIGENNFPVIVITNNAKKRIILHELSHSLFNLGDEYEGDIKKLPLEIKFKNLSLNNKDNSEWDYIKKLLNENDFSNYEGGLSRKKGIYRPYKDCLMRDIEKDLCPVCFYYAVKILNDLTKENKNFLDLINKNCKIEIKEINLKKVSMTSKDIF
ncbi:MAG TPA: M64 family metallopeptidase [Spirochaetota bacterium]|nr:M64 family metallopeptidase [Spirochaetota bacterium]HOL56801.1 M64 family metallopeptidase [Spirochaetota bacterium]HPP03870.1 M64 family metallopeptidase [Spirochaetota bacterium]